MLGDNILGRTHRAVRRELPSARSAARGCCSRRWKTRAPAPSGRADLRERTDHLSSSEKPETRRSPYAVIGIYMYDAEVFDIVHDAQAIRPRRARDHRRQQRLHRPRRDGVRRDRRLLGRRRRVDRRLLRGVRLRAREHGANKRRRRAGGLSDAHPGHRRRRLHRLATSSRNLLATTRTTRSSVLDKLTYAGNLDNLRRSPSDPRYRFVQGDIADAGVVERAGRRASTRWSTSPPRRTSTAGSSTPARSSRPTSTAPGCCSRRRARPGSSASCRSAPTRSTAQVADGRVAGDRPARAAQPLRGRRRPAASCWCWPPTRRTACRRWSCAARTPSGRTSTPRRSSRCT